VGERGRGGGAQELAITISPIDMVGAERHFKMRVHEGVAVSSLTVQGFLWEFDLL